MRFAKHQFLPTVSGSGHKNMQMLVEKANCAVLDVRVDGGDEEAAEEESVDHC